MANICDRISKEQFDTAYDHHLPSGWIKFAFRYFSRDTEMKDMAIKNTVVAVLIGLFLGGLVGTILALGKFLIGFATITYSIILASLVLFLFAAVFANNWRIRKIRKELGINKWEYEALVSNYYS